MRKTQRGDSVYVCVQKKAGEKEIVKYEEKDEHRERCVDVLHAPLSLGGWVD